VDADKENYINYHERALKLIRIGGIIAYDNTLWSGSVAASPDEPLPAFDRLYAESAKKFNAAVAVDMRVEVSQLSVADGVTLCRRVAWSAYFYKLKPAYNKWKPVYIRCFSALHSVCFVFHISVADIGRESVNSFLWKIIKKKM